MSCYLLEGDPGLLQQVGLDVAACQLSSDVEVNANELTLNSFIHVYQLLIILTGSTP
jgi:hypothetical protein